ncbi:hypothetical protein [Pseudomonas sp. MUP55]|uniref:hypothetical protein n=1 Tax=Pseudomonas sp. MUP55 TaxID=3087234 RepID=UPI002A5AE02C|nr:MULTISPECIES: hypothetical protein [unclassified Pseudomonas]WPN93856.1 hypothetical protein SC319_05670 [Pseudomonas sp. MUP56]WPN99382.1 hypothetical protein SC318_05670 [Pseudomonas sp. MUP55]
MAAVASDVTPPVVSPAPRQTPPASPQLADRWKERAGNTHNLVSLNSALNQIRQAIEKDPGLDLPTLLQNTRVNIHSLSTFGQANKIKPGEQVPIAWYLSENKLYVPQNLEQLANLIEVNARPLPEPKSRGNYWGLLSRPITLDSAQKTQLRAMVAEHMGQLSPGQGTFNVFQARHGAEARGLSTAGTLAKMIESAEMQDLGKKLEAAFDGVSTPDSATEWALTAMVLELDAKAGDKRGVVAGYDLNQPANWGVHPSVVAERLVQHLVDKHQVAAEMAPAAARLLLMGAAPAFIVADMPANLVVGSAAWARLTAAVEACEQWSPGIAEQENFQTLMARAEHSPVSEAQALVQDKAQAHALIEWGIAKGKIARQEDDAYTPAAVAALRDAFNAGLTAQKKAHDQLSAPMPNRREMALEQLKESFGIDGPFDVRDIRIAKSNGNESEYHSLLDIYMAGKTDRIVKGHLFDFSIGSTNRKYFRVRPLPDINQMFDSRMDNYLRGMKEAITQVVVKLQSDLPDADKKTIASGHVEFFSLRKASAAQAAGEESAAEAQAAKARYGLLMRVKSKIDPNGSDRDHKNVRYVYYEVFPLQGLIRPRHDLPRYLPNPPPRVSNPENYETTQAKGVDVAVDYEAYENGTSPQVGKWSGGLLTEAIKGVSLPELRPGQQVSTATDAEARFATIGAVVADHLLHSREAIKAAAKGVTEVEKEEGSITAAYNFVTGLVPFWSAMENVLKGNTSAAVKDAALDIFGFVIPFGKGVGQAGKALGRAGEKLGTRAFKASDVLLKAAFGGLNPGDGLGTLALKGLQGAKTLLQTTFRELQVLRQQGGNIASYAKTFGVVDGEMKVAGAASGVVGVTAKRHAGQWHAYDLKTGQVYGPPLKDFRALQPRQGAVNAVDNALFNRYAVSTARVAGLTPDSQGIYRATDNRLYIRNVDESGRAAVFQVREVGSAADQTTVQARLINPRTNRQTEFVIGRNAAGEWQRLGLSGGTPVTAKGVSIELPMEEVTRKIRPDGQVVFSASDSHTMRFDVELGAWRAMHGNQVRWRTGPYQWESGSVEEYLKAKDTLPKSSTVETINFTLPRIPDAVAPIPKEINYLWMGGLLPPHRLENIINNANKTPGYKSVVNVDADTPEVFQQIKVALEGKASNLEVRNLNESDVFARLKASESGEVYEYFRHGPKENYAAASDWLRYKWNNEFGGIHLDSNNIIMAKVDGLELNAAPGQVLMNTHVNKDSVGFEGYNNSVFASHKDNPVLQEMSATLYERFKANKAWLDSNRPYLPDRPTALEQQAFDAYEKRIFEITGPIMMNDVLEKNMGDAYHLSWVTARPDLEGVILPKAELEHLSTAFNHYLPFRGKVPVDIGSDTTMAKPPASRTNL